MLLVIARDAIKYWKGELDLFINRRESISHVFHNEDKGIFDDTYSFINSLILFFFSLSFPSTLPLSFPSFLSLLLFPIIVSETGPQVLC